MDAFTHQPTNLVTVVDGEPLASSTAIAKGVTLNHGSVMKLVRVHRASLERFGPLRFEIQKGKPLPHGGFAKSTEIALLNEHQSTLLIAMMRNTAIVIECKVRLVADFYRMRDALQRRDLGLWQQMQALIAREVESKVRASFGSHLMLVRKREVPGLRSEHERLELEIQPRLPLMH